MWSRAKKSGVGSKWTLSKYLLQLTYSGPVIKENKAYRRNPTYGNKRAEDLRKRGTGKDSWSAGIYLTFQGTDAKSTVDKHLRELIRLSFSVTLDYYVEALRMIAKAPNEKVAHEILNLFLKAETFQLVMTARQVYDFRSKADFDKLKKDPKFRFLTLGTSQPFGIQGIFGGVRTEPKAKKT